ncbi:site-2 protease family protein [Bacilliculturomica massiliensis]|uniref:site-2 protease family protein n=1 Tax=Bacilliculturomica massiliensis TaxID=1917867 RepID=UPI0010325854|nr:site-2 protease family protein [Bacilliculturomica massiliensis]
MRRFFNNPFIIVLFVILAVDPIMTLLTGGPAAFMNWFMDELLFLPAIIIGLSFHEYAHAQAADLCGDDTPRLQGRVTINPAAHIDPMGFLALIFIHFGWGRPVEINPRNFKHTKRDEIIVGLAGVTMNLFLAVVFGGIIKLITVLMPGFLFASGFGGRVGYMLMQIVWVNVMLMLFNLLPIPPLDGFNVAAQIFNFRYKSIYYTLYEHSMLILMVVVVFNIPGKILIRPLILICELIMNVLFGVPQWMWLM